MKPDLSVIPIGLVLARIAAGPGYQIRFPSTPSRHGRSTTDLAKLLSPEFADPCDGLGAYGNVRFPDLASGPRERTLFSGDGVSVSKKTRR